MLKKTLLVVAASILVLENLEGQTFTRITSGDIVNNGGNSWGVAWGDYDNDGLIDLFVANNGAENNFFYRNNGDGTFARITVGDIVNDGTWSSAGSWGDYDNDGDLDLFVSNKDENSLLFSNNGDGTFTKITTGIIVNDAGNSIGASWGDYDNDGDLDLFVANLGENNFLYNNNGDGTFTKITTGIIVNDAGNSNGASWGDYDNDGYLDLFVANGGELNEDNFLYSNNRDGTFSKITSGDIVNDGGRSSGSSWGDYDNDGDLDLFITNGAAWESQDNFLYQNNGDGNFIRISSGDIVNDGGNSWGSNWGDYDNDGDLDLYVTNIPQDNFLYSNNGDGTFIKITTGFIVTNDGNSLGVSSADYDNDGDLDLFVANDDQIDNYLFLNEGNANNWINIKLVGTQSNNSAIGATVRVRAIINGNPIWQMNEISGQTGGGFGGQNSLNAEFGLGDATIIDSIKVEWLSGVEIYNDVTINQFVTIIEGQGITGFIGIGEVLITPGYVVPGSSVLVSVRVTADTTGLGLFAEFESPDETPVDVLQLFDDGAHNDEAAGDSLYGNAWQVPPLEERLYFVDILLTRVDTDTVSFEFNNRGIFTTIGPMVFDSYTLFDTIPNPGEKIFLNLTLRNNGSTGTATAITADIFTIDTCVTDIAVLGQNTYGDIGSGATATTAGAYIVDVNENCAGDQDILFDVLIASEGFDFWGDSFTIHVFPTDTTIMAQNRWIEKSIDSVDGSFSQGVATDGVDWYFSARQTLFKTNYDFDFLVVNENPIPQFLQDQGYNHIGDIAYFEGKLYAPIEEASFVEPIIGLYDAVSLNFTGDFAQVPQSHMPWVAVDPRTGYFYSSEFNGVNNLFVYDPNQNFALIDEVQLDTTLSNVQGGAFLGDFLYLACDNGDFVYEVDIAFGIGIVKNIIKVPADPEMEGIEAYNIDSGLLHFVADTREEKNVFYHYSLEVLTSNEIIQPSHTLSHTLSQNYPNPFNPVSTIRYELLKSSDVSLIVYDILGREVTRLVDSYREPGSHQVQWEAGEFPSGIYFYRLQVGDFVQTRKMVLLK